MARTITDGTPHGLDTDDLGEESNRPRRMEVIVGEESFAVGRVRTETTKEGWLVNRAARTVGIALAGLSMALIAFSTGNASAGSPKNSAPEVPSDSATEYPQPEPVLHATFTDRDGGVGQVLYTISDWETGEAVLTDAPGPSVESGADSPFLIPTGTLTDGLTYGWTARSFDGKAYSAATITPNFVATTESTSSSFEQAGGTSAVIQAGNPWGCALRVDQPHPSQHQPKYIAAHSQTSCNGSQPFTMWIKHDQSLYRSSYSGWRFVGRNISYCNSGNHSSGQDAPACRGGSTVPMEAWVHWNCVDAGFRNQFYNYRQTDSSEIRSGGISYFMSGAAQSGAWNEPGNQKCGLYL